MAICFHSNIICFFLNLDSLDLSILPHSSPTSLPPTYFFLGHLKLTCKNHDSDPPNTSLVLSLLNLRTMYLLSIRTFAALLSY